MSTMNTEARNLLVGIVKNPYAWPGGYERLLVTKDGGLLCSQCCRTEARRIMGDIRDGYDTGWLPEAATYEAVSAECARECDPDLVSYCDHCGREFGELA
jgi:hypothetical protein